MHRSHHLYCFRVVIALGALVAGCGSESETLDSSGALQLSLELDSGVQTDEVAYEITGNGITPLAGTIDTSAAEATASVEDFGLPPGEGYLVALSATSVDGETSCDGEATFAVATGQATGVMVTLHCEGPPVLGAVRVDGTLNVCARLDKVVVSPLQTSQGATVQVRASGSDEEGDAVAYRWTAEGGSFANPSNAETTLKCGETIEEAITIEVSDDDFEHCVDTWTVAVRCVDAGGDLCEGVACDDENECTDDVCNPSTGECEHTPLPDGSLCAGGICEEGSCQPNSAWVKQESGTDRSLSGVSFTDANTGAAVGGLGPPLRTTDGGATWEEAQYNWEESPVVLLDVSFADANRGTAVGVWPSGSDRPGFPGFFGGAIVDTSNGGASWGWTESFTNEFLQGVSSIDGNTVVVGRNGTILRGIMAQESGTNEDLYDVSSTDANTATVVGDTGTILRTTNGGETWVAQDSGTTVGLRGVSFVDANTGTVVGGEGTILRTTDGGGG